MPHADPEKKRQYLRDWRANNPDKQKAILDRAAGKHEEYRKKNKDRYAQYQRDWRANNPKQTMIINARVRAKKSGLPCDITIDTLHWPTHCPVLGVELDYSATPVGERKAQIRHNYPTLDRKINELGYVNGNVFVISHRANRLKSDATRTEIEAVLQYMS